MLSCQAAVGELSAMRKRSVLHATTVSLLCREGLVVCHHCEGGEQREPKEGLERVYSPLSMMVHDGPLSAVNANATFFFTTLRIGKRARHPVSGHVLVTDTWE